MCYYWYALSLVSFVSLGGFLFGYDIGSMSGVMDMAGYRQTLNLSYSEPQDGPQNDSSTNVTTDFDLSCDVDNDVETAAILGLIVSLLPVGCLAGTLAAGFFSDLVGRKPTVIVGAVLVSCSGLIHLAAVNLWMVLLSRIIGGLGVGVLMQVAPIYVAEISPEKLRGRLLSFVVIYIYGAVMVGSIVNFAMNHLLFGWRISLGVQFVVGAVLALGMLLFPRSPRWLAMKHRDGEALKVLSKIYQSQDRAETQLKEIKSAVCLASKEPLCQTLKYIFQWKLIQRILIGFSLFFLGRFTGLNFIMYFSVTILCGIGLPGFAVSLALTAVAVISVLLSLVIIDKLGRKPILLIGTAVSLASHLLSASLLVTFDLEGTKTEDISASQMVAGYFVLVSLCVYMGFGVPSIGNVSWIIVNEIFPLRGRGFMIAVANSGFWIGLIASSQISSVLIRSRIGISGTLFVFAAVTFMLLLHALLLLPETKGLTLEKIEKIFSKPWLERCNVLYYLRCGCFNVARRTSREGDYQSRIAVSLDQEEREDSPTPSDSDVMEWEGSATPSDTIPLMDKEDSPIEEHNITDSLTSSNAMHLVHRAENDTITVVKEQEGKSDSPTASVHDTMISGVETRQSYLKQL